MKRAGISTLIVSALHNVAFHLSCSLRGYLPLSPRPNTPAYPFSMHREVYSATLPLVPSINTALSHTIPAFRPEFHHHRHHPLSSTPLPPPSPSLTRLLTLIDSLHANDVGVVDELHDGDLRPEEIFLLCFHIFFHDNLNRLPLKGVLVHAPILKTHVYKTFKKKKKRTRNIKT